jgi:RimJ/RimL family protein N-acetyltransferase
MAANFWQGQKVCLRSIAPEDWTIFYDWNTDTEVAQYSSAVPFPTSTEAFKKWVAEAAMAGPKNDTFRWVIENLDGGLVGTIHTHNCISRWGTFQYGVAIQREHWRKGYAAEAILLVLGYYFRELRYQKATVDIYAFNEASLRLHERLGFKHEGRLRRMIYTDGAYHDKLILGMTAEEFEGSKNKLKMRKASSPEGA